MTPERHARIKEIFLSACRLPPDQRNAHILEACHGDDELKASVDALLAARSEPAVSDDSTRTGTRANANETRRLAEPAAPPRESAGPALRRLDTGTIITGRYRIIAPLGKGGMGEVYRADDLTLNEPVALKFLPPLYASHPAWLHRFMNEVRVARTVTHPNVCRVFDIAEADGEYFISMEYVDGENLKSLLSRIGRLPSDKATQIARQLCAGLAAAHARGVLHRDLKPANVMIDGRGQVRITDFGLAGPREGIRGAEIRAGTPAYMAPEQLTGKDVSILSDIYSLGLVLYEVFTGRPAFEAKSAAKSAELKEKSDPEPPSRVVADIDPAIERLILSCIQANPQDRPASVLAVAAALPGGDALSAALAAGETPSPDLVAAAGEEAVIRTRAAVGGLAAFVVLLAAAIALTPFSHPVWRQHLEKSPQVLAERAKEVARMLGPAIVMDEASGFSNEMRAAAVGASEEDNSAYRPLFSPGGIDDVVYWHRVSDGPLRPADPYNVLFGAARVTIDDPHAITATITTVTLDPSARLLGFSVERVAPPSTSQPTTFTDWTRLLALACVEDATPCTGELTPAVVSDERRAWRGLISTNPPRRVRVEAAACDGAPVFMAVVPDDTGVAPQRDWRDFERRRSLMRWTWRLLLSVAIVGSIPLALRNLRAGRADLPGAGRVALFVYVLRLVSWLLQAHHASSADDESQLLTWALVGGLAEAMLVWVVYVALEPIARRTWPQPMISWSRILRGRFRDPVVGGHLLFGAVLGAYWAVVLRLHEPLGTWLGLTSRGAIEAGEVLAWLTSARHALAGSLDALRTATYQGLVFMLLLALLRATLRRQWAVLIVGTVLLAPLLVPRGSNIVTAAILIGVLGIGVLVAVMMRYGLATVVSAMFVAAVLLRAPLTLDMRAWYGDLALLALTIAGAVAVYGFVVGRQRVS